MKAGTTITYDEALEQFRWLAVDKDGSARVFLKEPIKIKGIWVPGEFPSGGYPACYRVEGDFGEKNGQLLRKNNDNEFVTHDG